MARLCVPSAGLCVYLLILLRISEVFTSSDYFVYHTDRSLSSSYHTLRLQDDHHIQRRQAPDQNPQIQDNRSNPIPTEPTNEVQKPLNKTITKDKLPNTYPNYTTQDVSNESLGKNLGENGTGIRKYFPTPVPVVNVTVGKNETSKPVETTTVKSTMNATVYNNISLTSFSDVGDETFNKTLLAHNISKTVTDTHAFYNSTFTTDPQYGKYYWVDMANRSDVKVSDLLSNSHRRAATVKLSFDFPFYGHPIRNVTIATGGFLYTGDYVHSWLAATQYIAPLMANFDTSLSNDSFIKYLDNGTAFTVQWERVSLQDKPDGGEFTFQVTLVNNGDIIFVYKNVPLFIERIDDDHHPVKVGLSDAYIMDHTIFFVRRKTIYEYHRVNFAKEDIKNWTVIYLTALPTCIDNKDCGSCLSFDSVHFECRWCPSTSRCSSGLDRNRQDWLTNSCDKNSATSIGQCAHLSNSDSYVDESEVDNQVHASSRVYHEANGAGGDQNVKMGVSGIIVIVFSIAMVSGLAVWVFYAYRNPHTTSGQMLIRYRPSQWRWRRGEPRYTVATIHM